MSHPTVLRINNEVNVFSQYIVICNIKIYIAGGLVVFTLNIFYFAAIVRTKINRERYGLTGMEFFADGLMGFAITLAGATLLHLTLHGQALKYSYRTPNSRCPIFNRIFYGTRISAATGSVILYIVTLFIVRQYSKRIKEQQNSGSVKINKRQLNFTKTVGLSCFATAGLYVLPMIVAFYETSDEIIPNSVYSIIVIISFLNSFSKTIIVGCRSHEIREAVIDLMPGAFRMTHTVCKLKA
uniref:G-protein coupled receptors family 1 profile domain-containing protein n=1 Tax=Wuchereria bancrofti TaxID=6293 RepID=A0AAF5PU33_WUCBA